MPTDFTVLMTGSDFLSGRMANFPGERRRDEARLSNMPCLGVRWAEDLPLLSGSEVQVATTQPQPVRMREGWWEVRTSPHPEEHSVGSAGSRVGAVHRPVHRGLQHNPFACFQTTLVCGLAKGSQSANLGWPTYPYSWGN